MYKVLIVEDSKSFRYFLSKALTQRGYEITASVEKGEEALDFLEGETPDIILMDIHLAGDLDGIETASRIRQTLDLPIIYMTSEYSETFMHRAAQTLPDGYLCKPFEIHHLLGVLDIALRKKQVERDLEVSRSRLENELRLEKEQWKETFDAVPDLIALVNENRRILRVNKPLSERLGLKREEIEGERCYRVIDGMEEPPEHCPLRHWSEHEETFQGEGYKERLQGYFAISCTPIMSEQQGAATRIHVLRDITERKKFEESLRKSEDKYRRLAEDMPNMLCTFLPDTTLTYVNQAYCDFFQKDREELIGRKWLSFLPWDARDTVLRQIQALTPETPFASYEHPVIRPDGSWGWQRWHDRGIFENEELVHVQSIGEDITERKQAMERLEENEKILQSVLQATKIAMIALNTDSKEIIRENQVARDLFVREKLLGQNFYQTIWPMFVNGAPDLDALSEDKPIVNKEVKIHSGEGRVVPVLFNAFIGEHHNQRSAILIFHDISERKALEMQLTHAQKLEAVGELAAGIAHEINTPTQYVGDNARFLKDAYADLQELLGLYEGWEQEQAQQGDSQWLKKIRELREEIDLGFLKSEIPKAIDQSLQGLERVNTIIRAMKKFSHPGEEEEKILFDLNEALQNTITICRNEWKYTSEVYTDLDPELPEVLGYPNDLNQAFLNLIINAAQAIQEKLGNSQEKGIIQVSTRQRDNQVEVSIQDSGKGVPEYYQDRIFDQFFTTKEVGKGTGQGLAITYSIIVDKHGGEITFDSREGEGTTFNVRLPLN